MNIYNVQDVSNWKDLNSKFVLQVRRASVEKATREKRTQEGEREG